MVGKYSAFLLCKPLSVAEEKKDDNYLLPAMPLNVVYFGNI